MRQSSDNQTVLSVKLSSKNLRLLKAIGGACLVSFSNHLLAQNQSEPATSLEPILVQRTRTDLLGIASSSSEGESGAQQLISRPVMRPGEVLELVPGLIATQHSGDGKANQYFLRGFNLDHGTDFATHVDGVPVNLRTHGHGQGYTDLNFLIPELVRRVSYRKGTYAAQDGDFSSAGSARIQLFSKLDASFVQSELGQHQFRRLVGAHQFASTLGNTLVGFESQGADGIWEVPQNYRKNNLIVKLTNQTDSAEWSINAMAYNARWTATDQVPLRAVEQGLIGRFGSLDPTTGGFSSRESVSFHWRRRLNNNQLRVNGYAVRSALNLYSNFTYFTGACSSSDAVNAQATACNDPLLPTDQFEQVDRRFILGADISYSISHTIGTADSTTLVGLQTRQDRIGAVGLYETSARERTGVVREDSAREKSFGLFVQNNSQWNSWLRTELGLRFDRFNFAVRPLQEREFVKRTASIVSPKASFTLGPWNKTELSVNWGEGFHSNDARGVTSQIDAATPLVKTRGSEFGIRSSAIRGLETTITAWQLVLGSELVFVGDAGTTEAGRPSKRRGVEWTNTWRPAVTLNSILGQNDRFIDWLTIDADFSVSRSRFTGNDPVGNKIPGSPQQVASIGLSADSKGRWYGGLRARFFGKRPLIEDGSVNSAANFMGHFKVGYRFNKNLTAELDIFNLFNKKVNDIEYLYASRLRGESSFNESTTRPDLHFHPSEPRNARLALKLSF